MALSDHNLLVTIDSEGTIKLFEIRRSDFIEKAKYDIDN